jgi:hypothetical protein
MNMYHLICLIANNRKVREAFRHVPQSELMAEARKLGYNVED